jgi:hypothetical protein
MIKKNKLDTKEYMRDRLLYVVSPEKAAVIKTGTEFQFKFSVLQRNKKISKNW